MTGSTGAASTEFVELATAAPPAADAGGFKVAYRSSAGTSDITLATIPAGTSIPAGGFYLLAGSGYLGSHAADQSFSTSIAATGGGVAVRDATGAILDSVGYGDTTNAFVEAMRPRHHRRPRLRAAAPFGCPTATTRTTTRPTSRSARRPRRAQPTTSDHGRAVRRACRPPITPKGHARPERRHRYCACGVIQVLAWRTTNCGNCGDWSHRSTSPRTPALPRAHARGLRAGRPGTGAPTGAARDQQKGHKDVGTRDARIHCGNDPRARAAAQPACGSRSDGLR